MVDPKNQEKSGFSDVRRAARLIHCTHDGLDGLFKKVVLNQ